MPLSSKSDRQNPAGWVAVRLGAIFCLMLLVGFGCFALQRYMSVNIGGPAISVSILFALPFCLAAIAALLADPTGSRTSGYYLMVPTLLVLLVLLAGGVALREGAICMILLAPLWWISAAFGAFAVRMLHRRFRERRGVHCSLLIALPMALVLADGMLPERADRFTVQREIIVEASPDKVWPHLLRMEAIGATEGAWNITQDILGVPRPASAIVEEKNGALRRIAKWGGGVSFEEQIVSSTPGQRLDWVFRFPNDSVRRHIDRHIAPDGPHLKIINGGYALEETGAGATRITLQTSYYISTPVNHYGALWAELMLGDIQSNVLAIIKQRSERE